MKKSWNEGLADEGTHWVADFYRLDVPRTGRKRRGPSTAGVQVVIEAAVTRLYNRLSLGCRSLSLGCQQAVK